VSAIEPEVELLLTITVNDRQLFMPDAEPNDRLQQAKWVVRALELKRQKTDEDVQPDTTSLLQEVGRTHLRGWLGYPRDTTRDGEPLHDESCRKCSILRANDKLRLRIWGMRPTPQQQDVKRRWQGPLLIEGKLTVDGRLIEPDAVAPVDEPIPLMRAANEADGHAGATLAGTIDRVWRVDDVVHGSGWATLPAGSYAGGADLQIVTSKQYEHLLVITQARLLAFTVYVNSPQLPAWSGILIEVEEAAHRA
jgi:hypothetical protein